MSYFCAVTGLLNVNSDVADVDSDDVNSDVTCSLMHACSPSLLLP
jgi:hypothetical protein